MTHDPLCSAQSCDRSDFCSCFVDLGVCLCQCDLIAKVTTRERVAAATRVLSVSPEVWKYIETDDRYRELASVDEIYASVLAGAPDPLLEQS